MTNGSFGDLLRQIIARKHGLTQTRLAHLIGYDQAVLTRMMQGKKDLTGPSGRERVVQIISALHDESVLTTQIEANALLKACGMSPLYDGDYVEAALLHALKSGQLLAPPALAPESTSQLHTNLPAQLSSFIGREREMAEVAALMAVNRLLTLTGSGGCGKTRLALEVGSSLVRAMQRPLDRGRQEPAGVTARTPAFPDGVWLAPLAPLSDSALVADALATTLGLRAANRPALDLVTDYLVDKQMLLLLDNCEHLIQACAEIAETLLRACPDLHILATSREPLNIPGEVTWHVPSLAADEAAQLFVERARAAIPEYTLTGQNEASVAQVCQRLNNIPLAIELAAARLRTFSVQQIAARLDDAFVLLTGGSRTALPRQQTLRATVDWSYNLLTTAERALLRHLSVFAGGWTLEMSEAVCANVAARTSLSMLLDQLVNKSLVNVDEGAIETRYHLLETIRQYAHEKLTAAGEHERAHASHLAFFADMVQTAQSHFHGPQELEWLDRLDAEIDNLRAALEWCAQTSDIRTGERLIDGMGYWWYARGYLLEGKRWIDLVLPADRTTEMPSIRATACIASGLLTMRMAYTAQADDMFAEAARLAHQVEDQRLIAQSSPGGLGFSSDHEQLIEVLAEVLRVARKNGLMRDPAQAQLLLAYKFQFDEQLAQAYSQGRELLAVLLTTGNVYYKAVERFMLGRQAEDRGDYAEARAQLDQMVSHVRALRDPVYLADTLIQLAEFALRQEDGTGVLAAIREANTIYSKVGNLDRPGQCASLAAGVALTRGELERAAVLLGAADSIWRLYQDHSWHHIIENTYHHLLPLVRARMDAAAFDVAWAKGQQMTVRQVMEEILTM